ncbi:MAG: hypothetical protein UR94_C0011G0012 [Parcubacteria group bacterium GW2011_GWA2_36_10]|nr:MAG: hypothetical protein UR94_C0011G0012 [Parcubacteria group bacterium GW2011_GWA2_36_10]
MSTNFVLPTKKEASSCVTKAYKQAGKGNPWRNAAWHLLVENHATNKEDHEQLRRLRNLFFSLENCGSPIRLITQKIVDLCNSHVSYGFAVRTLYHDPDLDLIEGEGHHWMKVLTEERGLLWAQPNGHQTNEGAVLAPEQIFCQTAIDLYDANQISRREAWEQVKHMLNPEPIGLFISVWPFEEEEFGNLAQDYWNGRTAVKVVMHRLGLWNFLVSQLTITPDDPRELTAFRRTFFRVSPTPTELFRAIENGRQEAPWNRSAIKFELETKFRNQLIPGELEFHLNNLWPEHRQQHVA